ncbi:hypothetical protein BE04_34635 [Sorangium cellulosum]|uniref:Uncharacterized protein n=2 Tax=Sorangium cellulosum TaxID=56 RepID=A0A150P4U7_SORCE|nr:hypothetical protein [Sorangium cellulosum]AGP40648.1 hypothetical protein SCE1572_42830 [Sorangium cellulosum So0157-2]KYF50646.1 hypothetical protein BE04_34635 [Sorangium cellulosum]KYG10019.1 hypothetical protein BE21_14635 [Sorangium cellulosum]
MHRSLIAQGLVLSLAPFGCSASPEIPEAYGKAVMNLNGEELVLDTGDDGKLPVPRFDDSWDVDCSIVNGETNLELADRSKGRRGFYYLDLHLLGGERQGGDAAVVNMRMYVDDELFDGSCPATLRTSQQGSHECAFSFAGCDLRLFGGDQDGIQARLERASFHLKWCFIP